MKNKGWFWLLIFLFGGGFSLVGDFFWSILGLFGGLLAMLIVMFTLMAPFYGLFKIMQLIFGGGKKSTAQSTARKERKLLKELNKYADKSNIIRINDEVYLELEKDPISLNTISIYMRDEYVSTLQEYKNAFPNAFNSMLDFIISRLKKGVVQEPVFREKTTTQRKQTTTASPAPQPAPAPVLKDASYFIEKFSKLDVIIEDEEISNGLVKCQDYLTQIAKIEKEFPETKEKTGKLYQYYLPMLVDILEEYVRLSENASNHREFTESKQRLAKTIMLINSALESISVTLCQEYYSNMSVDIKTLEALLKKDGYGNELDINALRKENGI